MTLLIFCLKEKDYKNEMYNVDDLKKRNTSSGYVIDFGDNTNYTCWDESNWINRIDYDILLSKKFIDIKSYDDGYKCVDGFRYSIIYTILIIFTTCIIFMYLFIRKLFLIVNPKENMTLEEFANWYFYKK